MTSQELLKNATSGAVLIVKGRGFVSRFIRALTGESANHVALLVRDDEKFFIHEFVERKGYNTEPLEKWMKKRKKHDIWLGDAPKEVAQCGVNIKPAILHWLENNSQSYGYLSLFKVWFAQFTRKKYSSRQKVCSTFIAEIWQYGCGYEVPGTPDPGDYFNLCPSVAYLG